MIQNVDKALEMYKQARAHAEGCNALAEAAWHRNTSFGMFRECDLLREAAWVILCSGFRVSVVRNLFDFISLSFCDWESATSILDSRQSCRSAALSCIKHEAKIDAILTLVTMISETGFETLKVRILNNPEFELRKIPFIGPITFRHLAKNLGMDVAKNDRHLRRLSGLLGYEDADDLCRSIASFCGESTRVVDLILWRYLADRGSEVLRAT
jgi:hypothetical protein